MKTSRDFKFILLGLIVIFIGVVKTLIPGETFKLGAHPIGLTSIIPGYMIVIIGVAIIIITLLVQFIVNRKG
jgi:hypothetical protein